MHSTTENWLWSVEAAPPGDGMMTTEVSEEVQWPHGKTPTGAAAARAGISRPIAVGLAPNRSVHRPGVGQVGATGSCEESSVGLAAGRVGHSPIE